MEGSGSKPVSERECDIQDCPVSWNVKQWSECSAACEQTRETMCVSATQTGYLAATCPESLTPVKRRVCIGGICPNVKNDTLVDLELKFKDGFSTSLNGLEDYLDAFREDTLCTAVQAELPSFDCNGETQIVSVTHAGRAVIRFRGPNCREALTAALDLFNNGIDAAVFDEKDYLLRHFDAPVVEGLPSAATVFSPVTRSSGSSTRGRDIGLGVGLGVGGFLLLVGAVVGGVFYFKKRRGGGGGGGSVPMSATASSTAYPV